MSKARILVPIDSSYKEYQKYKETFVNSPLWDSLTFLVDTGLDGREINSVICFDNEYQSYPIDYVKCDAILNELGFDGTLDQFCIVEFYQNKMLYRSLREHRADIAKKMVYIYEKMKGLDFDVLLYNAVSHFYPRFVSLVARFMGKAVYGYTQSLAPGKEFIWVDDEQFYCSELIERVESNVCELDSDYRLILNDIKEKKKKRQYLSPGRKSIKRKIKALFLIRNRMTPRTFTRARIKYWLNKFLFNKLREVVWKKASIDDIPTVPYVLFPLHMPGESQTLVRGYPFINDVEVLQQVSLALPSEYVLVVKEHPGYEGWKSLKELDVIKSLPNVYLIRSTVSSHDLIESSKAVVTINSSVWFESLAFNKPVFTFGRGVFTDSGVTNQVASYTELREKLNLLQVCDESFLPSQEKVEKFVVAYNDLSMEGKFYDYTGKFTGSFRELIQNKLLAHL